MPLYEYKCATCEIVSEEVKSYEDRFTVVKCLMCNGDMQRAFMTAPAQQNVSLPDGTKRKGFSDMKEAAKLEAEAMDSRPEERKRLESEVKKLRLVKV